MSFDESLTLSTPLILSGGGSSRINGGSLINGIVNFTGGATTLGTTSNGGVLNGITLNGNLDITSNT